MSERERRNCYSSQTYDILSLPWIFICERAIEGTVLQTQDTADLSLECINMEWEGQKLSEKIMQYLLMGSALVAFFTGYVLSSYQLMLILYVAGVSITLLFIVPDWSLFNKHPLEWSEPPPTGVPNSKLLRSRQQQAGKKSSQPVAKR